MNTIVDFCLWSLNGRVVINGGRRIPYPANSQLFQLRRDFLCIRQLQCEQGFIRSGGTAVTGSRYHNLYNHINLRAGVVEQVGSPLELYDNPANLLQVSSALQK